MFLTSGYVLQYRVRSCQVGLSTYFQNGFFLKKLDILELRLACSQRF